MSEQIHTLAKFLFNLSPIWQQWWWGDNWTFPSWPWEAWGCKWCIFGDGVGGADSAGSAMQCLGGSLLARVQPLPSFCQSDLRCGEQRTILAKPSFNPLLSLVKVLNNNSPTILWPYLLVCNSMFYLGIFSPQAASVPLVNRRLVNRANLPPAQLVGLFMLTKWLITFAFATVPHKLDVFLHQTISLARL